MVAADKDDKPPLHFIDYTGHALHAADKAPGILVWIKWQISPMSRAGYTAEGDKLPSQSFPLSLYLFE